MTTVPTGSLITTSKKNNLVIVKLLCCVRVGEEINLLRKESVLKIRQMANTTKTNEISNLKCPLCNAAVGYLQRTGGLFSQGF